MARAIWHSRNICITICPRVQRSVHSTHSNEKNRNKNDWHFVCRLLLHVLGIICATVHSFSSHSSGSKRDVCTVIIAMHLAEMICPFCFFLFRCRTVPSFASVSGSVNVATTTTDCSHKCSHFLFIMMHMILRVEFHSLPSLPLGRSLRRIDGTEQVQHSTSNETNQHFSLNFIFQICIFGSRYIVLSPPFSRSDNDNDDGFHSFRSFVWFVFL